MNENLNSVNTNRVPEYLITPSEEVNSKWKDMSNLYKKYKDNSKQGY